MVSVINGAICNSANRTGCSQKPTTAPAGFGSNGIGIDPQGRTVYVANIEDTSLTVLDVRTCNAARVSGCSATKRTNVARAPLEIAVEPAHNTVYVTNGDNTVTATNIGH